MELHKGRILQENQSSLEQVIFIKKRKLQDAVQEHSEKPEGEDTTDQAAHNTDPEVLELVEEIESLLEDNAT